VVALATSPGAATATVVSSLSMTSGCVQVTTMDMTQSGAHLARTLVIRITRRAPSPGGSNGTFRQIIESATSTPLASGMPLVVVMPLKTFGWQRESWVKHCVAGLGSPISNVASDNPDGANNRLVTVVFKKT
jgi:hypothetical protein